MLQKKICMVGASGVGKTSLVSRFVHSVFSEKYLTTVGVKIDKKIVSIGSTTVAFVIWDLAGVDAFHERIPTSYLRGSSGCFLVADGTRAATLDTALGLRRDVTAAIGAVPFVLAMNKADLHSEWQVSDTRLDGLVAEGVAVVRTSAKTGDGVEAAFGTLARLVTC
jgi:small GTP-binding protein